MLCCKTKKIPQSNYVLSNTVAFSRDRAEYFADKLYNAMSGLGTDDETLQRIIITHCEVGDT